MAPPTPTTAQLLPPGLRGATAFFNLLGLLNRRNSLYSEARRTQADVDAYYDKLRHEFAEDLLKSEMPTAPLQKPVRSLVRMTQALERERDAVSAQIEAEKNDASRNSNSEVGANLFDLLIHSSGGQRLVSDNQSNIERLRQAVELVQEAADGAALESAAQVACRSRHVG